MAIAYGLVAASILGYSLTVARDREQGVFQRLRVTPAPTWTIMTSRLMMQGVANLLITLVVLIVGSRLHHISLSAGKYGLVLLVSILAGAVFLSIGQALVGLVKSADSVNAAGRVLVIGLILLADPRSERDARSYVGIDRGMVPRWHRHDALRRSAQPVQPGTHTTR